MWRRHRRMRSRNRSRGRIILGCKIIALGSTNAGARLGLGVNRSCGGRSWNGMVVGILCRRDRWLGRCLGQLDRSSWRGRMTAHHLDPYTRRREQGDHRQETHRRRNGINQPGSRI